MWSDEASDKGGTDAFEIHAMFAPSQIAAQIFLGNAAKRAQHITGRCPQAFKRVGLDLPTPSALVIPRPVFLPMTHRVVRLLEAVIPWPVSRAPGRGFLGLAVPLVLLRLPVSMRPPSPEDRGS